MGHTINISGLKRFKFEHQLAGSFGEREHKELLAVVTTVKSSVEYFVYDHREVVFSGSNIEDAISHYNSI